MPLALGISPILALQDQLLAESPSHQLLRVALVHLVHVVPLVRRALVVVPLGALALLGLEELLAIAVLLVLPVLLVVKVLQALLVVKEAPEL